MDELFEWGFERNGEGRKGKLQRRWQIFHEKHPEVYVALVHYAWEWKLAGYSYCSINALFERVRWQIGIEKGPDGIKLNNNHRAFYSRWIECQEPGLRGFFRKRRQKIQTTFGPRNEDLPPGDHIS